MKIIRAVILALMLLVIYREITLAQDPFVVRGAVRDSITRKPVAYAQMASYTLVAHYAADSTGRFVVELPPSDSIRITAIGYHPRTFRLKNIEEDSISFFLLKPLSYTLREVKVTGYRGILDPLIFPRREPIGPQINLNLPSWIGSQTNPIPPSQRELMPSPSILQAVFSPVSFFYSRFSGRERSLRKLHKAEREQQLRKPWTEALSTNLLATWTQLEGRELENFIIYCNLHIYVTPHDNLLTLQGKVNKLLEDFNTDARQNVKSSTH